MVGPIAGIVGMAGHPPRFDRPVNSVQDDANAGLTGWSREIVPFGQAEIRAVIKKELSSDADQDAMTSDRANKLAIKLETAVHDLAP